MTTQGTRVDRPELFGEAAVDGGYAAVERDGQRVWLVRTPNGHVGDLSAHDVVEHEDGTITVSPSILVSNPQQGELWHGYLERGIWRSA
jgi:hypothetical protein